VPGSSKASEEQPMYVCLCNAISDRALREIGAEGVRSAQTAYARLGSYPQCGACLEAAERVLCEPAGANNGAASKTEAA
jgi:bacterioferritin-associated ferredoxin